MEIIVLARRDRKRSATVARRSPATYFLRLATVLRERVDIMDFSRVVPLLTLRYI